MGPVLEGGSALTSISVSGRELGAKGKQLRTSEASMPSKMPGLAWEGSGTARRGIQDQGRPRNRGASVLAAPTAYELSTHLLVR